MCLLSRHGRGSADSGQGLTGLVLGVLLLSAVILQPVMAAEKPRIAIVSSYHKDYLWSQDTSRGVNAALMDFGYLDHPGQATDFIEFNYLETSRAVLAKFWMDTKRRDSDNAIKESIARIVTALRAFEPDILLLGDDNATNHIGNQYVDTSIPVVFWGVNGNPMKYGLLDSIERPGHNVTGVYQAGYLREGVIWLKRLLPEITNIGVLSDDSPTGRAKVKELLRLAQRGELPVTLKAAVVTNSVEIWKRRALEFNDQVDAIFLLNHNTLKNPDGTAIDQLEIGAWYLTNVRKPDIGHERQFVEEGVLCAVDDSGFKQGYEATRIAHRILAGADPAEIGVSAPSRGPFLVNVQRARMLGIEQRLATHPLIEERIPHALALKKYPQPSD